MFSWWYFRSFSLEALDSVLHNQMWNSTKSSWKCSKNSSCKINLKKKHMKDTLRDVTNDNCIITKTRLFKYIENFTSKKSENFQIKNWYFSYFAQNIDCEYSLELPHWGGSKITQTIDCEYSLELPRWCGSKSTHNLCFWAKIRKIMFTPENPSFTI